MSQYEVGQHVWIRDYDIRGDCEGLVVKVGRKLVTVKGEFGALDTYRMDTGHINDNYGHSRILTDEERDEDARRKRVLAALAAVKLRPALGCKLTVDQLEAAACAVGALGDSGA